MPDSVYDWLFKKYEQVHFPKVRILNIIQYVCDWVFEQSTKLHLVLITVYVNKSWFIYLM